MRYIYYYLAIMVSLGLALSASAKDTCETLNGTWHGVWQGPSKMGLSIVRLTIHSLGNNKYGNLQYIDRNGHRRVSHQLHGLCDDHGYVHFYHNEWLSHEHLHVMGRSNGQIEINYDWSYILGIAADRIQSKLVKQL